VSQALKLGQLRFATARQTHIVNRGQLVAARFGVSDTHRNRDRCPNRKHVDGLPRGELVAFEIDNPQLVERVAQLLTQAREAGAAQIRGCADEADDARSTPLLEHGLYNPAPEVDIIVVGIFEVDACAWHPPAGDEIGRCGGAPRAAVGWIAEAHHDRRIDGHRRRQHVALRDVESKCACQPCRASQWLEQTHTLREQLRRTWRALERVGNHRQRVRATAGGWVHDQDALVAERAGAPQALLQQIGRQAHLGRHHWSRRVIHTSRAALRRGVGLQKVFVQVRPAGCTVRRAAHKLIEREPLGCHSIQSLRLQLAAAVSQCPRRRL